MRERREILTDAPYRVENAAFLLSNDNNIFRERKSTRALHLHYSKTHVYSRALSIKANYVPSYRDFALVLSLYHNANNSQVALLTLLAFVETSKSAFPTRRCSWRFSNSTFDFSNWIFLHMLQQYASKHGEQSHLVEQMNTKYYYYTRTQGLFRICYPKERPPTGNVKTKPIKIQLNVIKLSN